MASVTRLFALVVVFSARVLSAQTVTAIVHGQVIDGNGGPPLADAVVLVRGDRIVAVGPGTVVSVPASARVIDARGRTVMPGLADLHVHLSGGWDGVSSDVLGYQRYLNALLYAGVTTIFDTGNMLPFVQQLRQEVAAGRIPGPTIHMVGPLVDGPDPAWPPLSIAVVSSAQLPKYVKQLKDARVDMIKAYVGLSDPMLRALVAAAAAESLRVVVDAGGRNGMANIALTGIAAFAHLGTRPLTDETISIMRDRHVATMTTLAVTEFLSRRRLANLDFLDLPLLRETMPPRFVAELREFAARPRPAPRNAAAPRNGQGLEGAMANVKRLVDAGILVAAGTDAPYPGVFYGESLHRELELIVEAGLTPLQAITIATKNAALFLREDGEWGTLEAGRRADVLIVSGNPAKRIGDTRNIEIVMQRGVVIDRTRLRFDPAKDPGFRTTGLVDGVP
jgi:imidazolonepropionase-like amidohydrolase